ncbi:glycosyltransferase [Streptomyces sp. DSM 44917]|uniref:Glycosyltransferase n=1 Tax=Streptomyces boetiae TaxID=3075541 RepID=A0ABU2L8R7_9ACTN|nr:glycosyltransferase [Streptomyces sp. DSM 44917]MDT0307967.1 glycosyltransferase [Streptomyces sp. DSM 44917]
MSRFLFVVPPLVGHVNPAAAVARELAARGHEVAWAGDPGLLERLLGPRDPRRVFACGRGPDLGGRPEGLRGVAALKFLWDQWFAPLAEVMAPGVEAAVREFRPDVVVADQQTVAGSLVAERLGVPFATSSTTSAELAGAVGLPKVDAWIREVLAELRQRLGAPEAAYDPRFSPLLTLVFSTPELAGPPPPGRGPLVFVGPALGPRPAEPGFPRDWPERDPDRALVLITLGTANTAAGTRFLSECVTAVRERADRLRAVVADPGGVLGGPAADEDVLVAPRVPQLEVLARAGAVVCHAGHNTVAESLWHGVPLVVAPIRDDQPVIAGQVTEAGAGVRIRFGRSGREAIGAALDAVLGEPSYAAAARRIGDAFRAAGGAPAAAGRLERAAAAARVRSSPLPR